MRWMRSARFIVISLSAALLALAVSAPAFAAKPGNSLNAKACYKGGWATMATANGVPFASQDECVANGATGGSYGTPARIFATAFTNLDGVAGFSRTADVLIAELIDSNRDNAVNAGDTVHMGRYPLDLTATTFGSFAVTSHTVTGDPDLNATNATVLSGGPSFFTWSVLPFDTEGEMYQENPSNDHQTLLIDTRHDSGGNCRDFPDAIYADPTSPSQPSVAVPVGTVGSCDASDQTFVDVTLNLP